MKEVKEEKVREVKDTFTYYEATDGTRFTNEDECRKYEATALCIAKAKLKNLIVTKECNAWETMGGYEDNSVFGVKVATEEEADAIKHWLLLDCTYLQKEDNKDRREKYFDIIDSAIGDILIMGINCEGDWYVINSRQNLISNLNKLDKKDNA